MQLLTVSGQWHPCGLILTLLLITHMLVSTSSQEATRTRGVYIEGSEDMEYTEDIDEDSEDMEYMEDIDVYDDEWEQSGVEVEGKTGLFEARTDNGYSCDSEAAYFYHGVFKQIDDMFCKNGPVFDFFDSAFDSNRTTYYGAFQNDIYIGAKVTMKGQLLSLLVVKKGWSEFKSSKSLVTSNEFEFKDKAFFRKGVYQGLSQQWLGCPMSLCVASQVNAVFQINGKDNKPEVRATVGYHEWSLSSGSGPLLGAKSPLAMRLVPNAVISFYEERQLLFIRDTGYVLQKYGPKGRQSAVMGNIKARPDETYHPFPNIFPELVDSVALQAIGEKTVLYIFKGQHYWKAKTHWKGRGTNKMVPLISMIDMQPIDIESLNPFFKGKELDEVFIDYTTKKVTFFMKWWYFTTDLKDWLEVDLKTKTIIKLGLIYDMFNCPPVAYEEMGFGANGYAKFKKEYLKIDDSPLTVSTTALTTPTTATEAKTYTKPKATPVWSGYENLFTLFLVFMISGLLSGYTVMCIIDNIS